MLKKFKACPSPRRPTSCPTPPKKGAYLLNKTLKSALANAENNAELSVDTLVVKSVMVDEGPTMRRTMPRARGSANMIRKRTSHITVVLADQEG